MKNSDQNVRPANFIDVLRIFNRNQIMGMAFFAISQASFSFLDLFGIVLIGVLTSLVVRDFAGLSSGLFSSRLLDLLRLSDNDLLIQIGVLSLLALVFFLAKGILLSWTNVKMFDFFGRQAASLSYKLFKLTQEIPHYKMNTITSQRLTYALTGGSTSIMLGVGATTFSIIADGALIFVILCGLLYVDTLSTVCLFLSSLIFFALTQVVLNTKIAKYSEQQAEKIIESQEIIHLMKNAYKEILVSNSQEKLNSRFLRDRENVGFTSSRIKLMPVLSRYALDVFLIILIVELVFLQVLVSDFPRSLANLSVFFASLIRIIPAMQRLQQSLLTIKSNLKNLDVAFQVFSEITSNNDDGSLAERIKRYDRETQPNNGKFDKKEFRPEVALKNLSFGYSADRLFLKDLNLTVLPKTKMLITGKSGSGKTSLLDLILGVHEPISGSVEISGLPPRQAFRIWPGQVLYLPQEITLFKGSLRDNILFPRTNEKDRDEEITQLLNEIGLKDLLSNSRSLDDDLGDRGNSLSGGQKQRIGIVRALLWKPELLILDEATNALDSPMEEKLMNLLMSRMHDSTVIVVSHSKIDRDLFNEEIDIDTDILQRKREI